MRLLLVEDNRRLADLVRQGVARGGHGLDIVHTREAADHALSQFDYALLILDLGLPDGDGLQLLQHMRRRGMTQPCLILTARDAVGDRVTGLDAGADDYLTKPFAMEELVARINALLRRPANLLGKTLERGKVRLDPRARTLAIGDKPVHLPHSEFAALECLLRAAGGRCSRRRLEDSVYGMDAAVTPNALEVLVHRLRRHLERAGADIKINAVRGFGYALEDT